MYKTMVSSTTTAPRERGGGLARRLLLAVLALVAVLPIAALGAQSAHAGTYTERVCAPGSGSGETVYAFTGGWYRHSDGCSTGGPLSVSLYPNRWYGAHEGSRYTYTAPSGTKIVALSTNRVKTAGPARDSGDASSYLRDSNGRVLDGCTTRTGCHGAIGNVAFDLSSNPASSFTFGVECWGPSWCPPGNTTYAISNMKITLDDNQAPVLAGQPTGPAMSDEVLHGDEVLNFSASDIGGGLYRTRMLVDGTPTDAQICAWVERELGHMIPDGVCGTGQLMTFRDLVQLGPFAHPCLAHFLEHGSPAIADNALAVLMSTGCEGSMLAWCAERGEPERCKLAQRWHRDSLLSVEGHGAPVWISASIHVNEAPPRAAIVRIVQLTTGTVYYADPAPTGEFAMPFTSSGRYKFTVFLEGNTAEDAAPSFELVIDDLPGDLRIVRRFGEQAIDVVVLRAQAGEASRCPTRRCS